MQGKPITNYLQPNP